MATRDVNNDASSRAVNMAQVEGDFIGKGFMSSTKSAGAKYGNDFAKSTKSLGTKWGETLGEAAGIVINRVVKEGVQSFNRVTSNFLKDYDAISARLNKNFHEYRQYYNDLNSQLRETGMNIAFSMKDVTAEMMNNMSMGMRGKKLEEKTMSDLIVKKLIPSINTNTRGYTTLYKKLGDSFAQTQTALAKYSESLIGLEAMERGDIQSTMDSLNLDLMYSAKIGGLDTNKVMAGLQSVLYAAGASEYGSDYLAGKFEEIIKGEMTPENASLMMQLGVSNGEELARMLSSPELTRQLVERIAEYSKSFMGNGGGGKLIAGKISGGSTEDAVRGVVADEFVEAYKKLDMENFDAEKVYAKAEGDALAGYFNTPSEKLENFEDSIMNDVGTLAAGIPHMSDLIGDIGGIITSVGGMIINAIFASRLAGRAGGGGGGGSLLKNGLIKIGRRGAAYASESSALFSGATTVGGVLGGAAVAGIGGVEAYKDFRDGYTGAGVTNAIGAGFGAAGAITAILASGPIGLGLAAIGGAFLVTAKVIKNTTDHGRVLNAQFDKLKDSVHETNSTLVGAMQDTFTNLKGENEIRSALVDLGYREEDVQNMTIESLERFRDKLAGMTVGEVNDTTDQLIDGMKQRFKDEGSSYDLNYWKEIEKDMEGMSEEEKYEYMRDIMTLVYGDDTEGLNKKLKQLQKDFEDGSLSDNGFLGWGADLANYLYDTGESANKIAERHGISGAQISKVRRKHTGKELTELEQAWINLGLDDAESSNLLSMASMYLSNINSGDEVDANKNALVDLLKEYGIKPGSGEYKLLLGENAPLGIDGYRTGLGYVPYDNYPALLHEGEAVLTKGESSKFRSVLTALGLSSTLSVSNAGTEVVDIMSTIATKIDSLGNVLDSILQVIVDIADGQNTTNIVPTNRNLTNYSGGAIE